jgi:glutamine synthetase
MTPTPPRRRGSDLAGSSFMRDLNPDHVVRPEDYPTHERTVGASKKDIMELVKEHKVRFLRLQFSDILGHTKNIELPAGQFEKALDGEIMFDGSSIEGFVRIEESDMLLKPDLDTFRIFPWGDPGNRVARIICDVYQTDETPFAGDPRGALKRILAGLKENEGYDAFIGMEAEFFLFHRTPEGEPTVITHDTAGYFDLTPVDRGEVARRDIVNLLEAMGFEVEAAHHEVAPGQHEVDFRYEDALITADNIATFKFVVRNVALRHGLHATFMPKPIFGQNGSGMHTHQSLFDADGENVFHDPEAPDEISDIMRHYVGGLLRHARGYCAVTNPVVNSYKRLVPGYEAPVNVAWSLHNRSPMIRVPAKRGQSTRCELRIPDPAANPYLALAVQIAAGMDGVHKEMDPRDPVNKNIWTMSQRERRRLKIEELPRDLGEALEELEKDKVVRNALGEHIYGHFMEAKRAEWQEYISQVHSWEIEKYLAY